MRLPRYSRDKGTSIQDFQKINNLIDLNNLIEITFESCTYNFNKEEFITYLKSDNFKYGAEYSDHENDLLQLSELLSGIYQIAKNYGFPHKITTSKIDFDKKLSIFIYEFSEQNNIVYNPGQACDTFLQEFFTHRLLLPLTYWRWQNEGKISEDRFKSGARNYFFYLFLIAYLFDKGKFESERWSLMDALTADIIVQIIERPGIGYRKGFAQALSKKILNRKKLNPGVNYDKIVRGIMKRAKFTFSVSSMPDEIEYYNEIIDYLFEWSVENYIENDHIEKSNTSLENDNLQTEVDTSIFYIKRLTSNELGYRKGEVKTGQTFYIAKNISQIFPSLNEKVKNDSIDINVFFENRNINTKLKFVYHNDKNNTIEGTRNEYRIYLNKDIVPAEEYLMPDDIVIMQRLHEIDYKLILIRKQSMFYNEISKILKDNFNNSNHALINNFKIHQYYNCIDSEFLNKYGNLPTTGTNFKGFKELWKLSSEEIVNIITDSSENIDFIWHSALFSLSAKLIFHSSQDNYTLCCEYLEKRFGAGNLFKKIQSSKMKTLLDNEDHLIPKEVYNLFYKTSINKLNNYADYINNIFKTLQENSNIKGFNEIFLSAIESGTFNGEFSNRDNDLSYLLFNKLISN